VTQLYTNIKATKRFVCQSACSKTKQWIIKNGVEASYNFSFSFHTLAHILPLPSIS